MKNSFTFRRLAKLAAIPVFALAAISCTDTTHPVPSGALVVVNANSSLNQLQLRIDDQTDVFGPTPLGFNTRCCLDVNGSPSLLIPALDTVREIAFYNGNDTTTILKTNLKIETGVTYVFIVARNPDGSPLLRRVEGNQDPIKDHTLIRFINASYQSHLVAGGVDIYITDSTATDANIPSLNPRISDLNYMEDRGYIDVYTLEGKFKVFVTPTGQPNNIIFRETYETSSFHIMTPGTVRTVFLLNGTVNGVEAFPLSPFIVGF